MRADGLASTAAGLPANRLQVRQYMGISADEAQRIKDSRHRWITHDYPLADEGWRRADCARWFAQEYPGRTLSRSACVGCPFHSAAEWEAVSKTDPDLFADACEWDEKIRAMMLTNPERRAHGPVYLHRRRKPLAQAVALDTVEIESQGRLGERVRGTLRSVTCYQYRHRNQHLAEQPDTSGYSGSSSSNRSTSPITFPNCSGDNSQSLASAPYSASSC